MFEFLKIYTILGFIAIVAAKDLLADRRYCGYQHSDDYIRSNQNITIDEFPWMVQLLYDNGIIRCSGSLINNRYVLTAAHCLRTPQVYLRHVRLGDYNVKTVNDCVPSFGDEEDCSEPFKDFDVEEIITHPAYDVRKGLHDIGLIRLSKSVLYSDYIRPICLPRDVTIELKNRSELVTSGWGKLGFDQKPTELKKKVLTKLITNEECLEIYNTNKMLFTDDHLCVAEYESLTCHGDNGAPIMRSVRNQWEQVGVLVSGTRICSPNYSIFSKVTSYLEWIKAKLRP